MKQTYHPGRIYRDELRRKVSGVCAGVAKHFGVQPMWVRLLAIVAFFIFPVPVIVAYAAAVVLLPKR